MTATPAIDPQLLDPAGAIGADVPCRRCNYNLRGLSPEGKCPECGVLVDVSIRGDLLRYSDPTWLDRLALGLKYTLWGALVLLVCATLNGVLMSATSLIDESAGAVIGFLGGLLGIYGAWLLTSPEPGRMVAERYATDRRVVRICLIIGLARSPATVLGGVAAVPEIVSMALMTVSAIASLADLVGLYAKLRYLEKLALRAPEPKLAGNARWLRWGLVIAGGSLIPLGVVGALVPQMLCVIAGPFVAIFVLSIAVMVLYFRLMRVFRLQAEFARAIWEGQAAGAEIPAAIPIGDPPLPPDG